MVSRDKVVVIGAGILVAASFALAKFSPGQKHLVLDTLTWLALLYALVTPAVPWIFAPGNVWSGTGIALLILVVLHASLWRACAAANCGQGAILVVVLWGVAGMFGFVTLVSAWFARNRKQGSRPGPDRL
jgi:hypothetical protein